MPSPSGVNHPRDGSVLSSDLHVLLPRQEVQSKEEFFGPLCGYLSIFS